MKEKQWYKNSESNDFLYVNTYRPLPEIYRPFFDRLLNLHKPIKSYELEGFIIQNDYGFSYEVHRQVDPEQLIYWVPVEVEVSPLIKVKVKPTPNPNP